MRRRKRELVLACRQLRQQILNNEEEQQSGSANSEVVQAQRSALVQHRRHLALHCTRADFSLGSSKLESGWHPPQHRVGMHLSTHRFGPDCRLDDIRCISPHVCVSVLPVGLISGRVRCQASVMNSSRWFLIRQAAVGSVGPHDPRACARRRPCAAPIAPTRRTRGGARRRRAQVALADRLRFHGVARTGGPDGPDAVHERCTHTERAFFDHLPLFGTLGRIQLA